MGANVCWPLREKNKLMSVGKIYGFVDDTGHQDTNGAIVEFEFKKFYQRYFVTYKNLSLDWREGIFFLAKGLEFVGLVPLKKYEILEHVTKCARVKVAGQRYVIWSQFY